MKIYLFRNQRHVVKLTMKEEAQLQRIVLFGALLYTKSWTEAPLAADAPGCDLKMWKDLVKYEVIDHKIASEARKILERHMWYLSDETVGLALFSDTVSSTEKAKIVAGFTTEPGARKVRGDPAIINEAAHLGDFSTKRSAMLLLRLHIDGSFLTLPPEEWINTEAYEKGTERIMKLRVVNDTAERGVK